MITIRRTRDNRETMKRDNSFPMAMNYRINSRARARARSLPREIAVPSPPPGLSLQRNQLFCFVAKPIAFRSNRIFLLFSFFFFFISFFFCLFVCLFVFAIGPDRGSKAGMAGRVEEAEAGEYYS